MDRFTRALRWITRGLRRLEGVPGTPAAVQRAQLRAWYGHFSQDAGRHSTAIKWCRLAMAEAEVAGDKDALAHALRIIDWAYMDLGRLESPDNLVRALALYQELGDLAGAGGVLNMLGGIAYWRGQWSDALDYYGRAEEIVIRTGNTAFQANCRNNIGEILVGQGRLDEARSCFEQARRIWRAAGYRSGVCAASRNLAQSMQDDLAAARKLFDEALDEARLSEDQVEEIETRTRLAEFLLVEGDPAAALELADETLLRARALGGVAPSTPVLQRVRGVAAFQLGDGATAELALAESLVAAQTREALYELALTLRTRARLLVDADDPTRKAIVVESTAIFERLGVVSVLDWNRDRSGVLASVLPASAGVVAGDDLSG
jgi:tetratricopeptide (TPR) repeat protein